MKIKINESRLKEIIAEEMAALEDKHHMHHVDKEGKMAKRQLYDMAKYAMMLHDSLENETQLESWVQSKITLASDYISKVKHYLEYEMGMQMEDPEMMPEESDELGGCGDAVPMPVSDGEVFTIDDEDAYLMET